MDLYRFNRYSRGLVFLIVDRIENLIRKRKLRKSYDAIMQLLNSNDFVKNPKSIYFNGLELKNKYNLTQMDSNPNHIQLVRQIELSDNHLIEEVETAIIQLWSRNLKEIEKETMDEVITGKDRFKDLFEKTDNHWDVPLKDKYSIEDDGKYSQRVKFEWQVSVGEQAKKIVGLLSPYRYRLK